MVLELPARGPVEVVVVVVCKAWSAARTRPEESSSCAMAGGKVALVRRPKGKMLPSMAAKVVLAVVLLLTDWPRFSPDRPTSSDVELVWRRQQAGLMEDRTLPWRSWRAPQVSSPRQAIWEKTQALGEPRATNKCENAICMLRPYRQSVWLLCAFVHAGLKI